MMFPLTVFDFPRMATATQKTDAEILFDLSRGMDPHTGESIPFDHILMRGAVIRALMRGAEFLAKSETSSPPIAPNLDY